jgi:hypothetical protein
MSSPLRDKTEKAVAGKNKKNPGTAAVPGFLNNSK